MYSLSIIRELTLVAQNEMLLRICVVVDDCCCDPPMNRSATDVVTAEKMSVYLSIPLDDTLATFEARGQRGRIRCM
jgi:hypothetical protein